MALLAIGAESAYRLFLAVRSARNRARAPQDVFEIYGVGESTIAGVPYKDFSFPDLVSKMFSGRIAGRRIEVINLAKPGESIYPQAVGFERRLASRNRANPGAVFIYSGHNDPGQPRRTPFFEYLKEDILLRSRILRDLLFFADQHAMIPRVRTMQTYEYNLRRVIELSRDSGLVPILSTVVSNASDMDPGLEASKDDRLTPYDFREIIRLGERMEAAKQYRKAIGHYKRFMGEARVRPYLMYKIGECRRRSGDYGMAHWFYWEAIDLGSQDNFMRATDSQNSLLRGLAREYDIPLVDSVKIFEEKSPHGITGNGLFADGHHPNIKGEILLANAFARQVSSLTREPIRLRVSYSEDTDRIFKALSYSKQDQVTALLRSGRWLFTVSAQQLLPQLRLGLARERFKSALALQPGNFSATLGLALVDAAMSGEFLRKEENINWLSERRFFYGAEYKVSEDSLPGIIRTLRSAGTPEPLLTAVQDAYRGRSAYQ